MHILWRRGCPTSNHLHVTTKITILSVGLLCIIWLVFWEEDDWQDDFHFMKTHADSRVKKITFWTTWYGQKRWGHFPERRSILNCGVNVTCHLYNARSHPLSFDALIFHGVDSQRLPPQRSPHQAYIMFLQESPAYRANMYIPGKNFYNWTITYSRTSDLIARYFTIRNHRVKLGEHKLNSYYNNRTHFSTSGNQSLKLATRDDNTGIYYHPYSQAIMHHSRQKEEAIICWVVSNCNTNSRRELYAKALNEHLAVDVYGKCGRDACNLAKEQSSLSCIDFLARTGQYKFYLSFENSACRDYITEKVSNALKKGLVPIVYGGLSTDDYEAMLPPESFIDVRNFTSPKHLAEYLMYLDRNDKAYLKYHAWRTEWEVDDNTNLWCNVCRAVHNVGTVPQRNVDWGRFWDPATECDDHLLEKVLGKDHQS